MTQGLQMPAVVSWSIGELWKDGDEQGSDGHILSVEGVISVAQKDESDRHVNGHAEPIVEYFTVLELLTDNTNQFQTLEIASACHYDGKCKQGGADQREQFILID